MFASFRPLRAVSSLFARSLLLLAPPLCAACDAPLGADVLFCEECEPSETVVEDQLAGGLRVAATAEYAGAMAAAIRRYKYGARPDLARLLARRLVAPLGTASFDRGAWLVPVPLHAARLAERGYNQSALVARAAGRMVGLRALPRALVRIRETTEQAALAAEERRTNVSDAFVAKRALTRLRDAPVILVDDVVTTGATALACVRAMERVGVNVVCVAALARAGRSSEAGRRVRIGGESRSKP